jgi:hypothetical protein
VRVINRMETVFAVGPSRFRARFYRDFSWGECEVVDLYFRAEPIADTAAVACVISGTFLFPEAGDSEASNRESTIAR